MAHDGSPCEFLPKPQPRIGVQQTAPSRYPLASSDPTERWLAPDLWRQADLLPVERRHEKVVPTPVKSQDAARMSAPTKPLVTNPAPTKPLVTNPAPTKPLVAKPAAPAVDKTAAAKSAAKAVVAKPAAPVVKKDVALKAAPVKPAITRAVSLPVGFEPASALSSRKADLSLPRLVRAAELASQTEAIQKWIAAQDGIEDILTGVVFIQGANRPLDQSVINVFAKAAPPVGSMTPWTVSLHVGPQSVHVFDSNRGFDNRGVRVSRTVSPVEPKLWIDDQWHIAEGYVAAAKAGVARIGSGIEQIAAMAGGLVDLGVGTGSQIQRTADLIVARLPSTLPALNRLPTTDKKPTEVGGKPSKIRSAGLPGKTQK
jgi:hypothetical protein